MKFCSPQTACCDLSAYFVFLYFQAINLTDTVYRRYNTIRDDTLLPSESLTLGEQYTGRTSRLHNVGTTYRLSARLTF
ncbi:hypothetical protein [Paraglaciecola sp. L3A3]|uniref:hypothetical protein n=1 Tax=Paraglaciecola sp. L3A3 TaxID=2686358 RepID=UPI00131CA138|nr:hypothetical protein [Paraglaciecola sp. L3A3]